MTPAGREGSEARGDPRVRADALAGTGPLGWLIASNLLASAVVLSPLAHRIEGLSSWVHYAHHLLIVGATIVLAAGVRDLTRARPLAGLRLAAAGAVGAAAGVSAFLTPVREDHGSLHFLQHSLVVLAAALAGVLLRDALLARSGHPAVAAGRRPAGARTAGFGEAWRAIPASWFPLAAVLVLAAYVRVASLGFQSLTDDEGYSFALAQRSFGDMLGLFHWEGNGTLYSLILWPLVRVSESADMLRMPAALASVAAVAAVYWAGRELATRQVALLGAFLLALSPMALRYAQFARPFSFVPLFAALSFALLARHLRTSGTGALVGYAAVLGLAAHANSLAPVLLVPVHALLVAPAGRRVIRRWLVALAGAVAVAGPVIVLALVETGKGDPLYWLPSPSPVEIARVAQEFMIGRALTADVFVRGASVAAVLATTALIAAAVLRRGRGRPWNLVALAFVPLAVALAISVVRPVFFGAYLIVALPGLCLLLAAGALRLSPRRAAVAVAILGAAWLTADVAMMRPPHVADYRSATAWIVSQRTPGDPLVIDPITRLPGYAYYDASLRSPDGKVAFKEWRERPLPAGVTGFTDPGGYGDAPAGPPSAAYVSRLAARTGRLVLVIDSPYRQGAVADGAAARWMRGHCALRESEFGGIIVLAGRDCRASAR